jgi:hypothetical protein
MKKWYVHLKAWSARGVEKDYTNEIKATDALAAIDAAIKASAILLVEIASITVYQQ